MQFNYRAVDGQGASRRGKLEAANEVDLETRLGRLDLFLIEAKPVKAGRGLFGASKISLGDLITFCFHLEQLTRAGVPLLEGLGDLRDTLEHLRFRNIVATMIEDIEGGLQLSQAMEKHPQVFNVVFWNLVRAGEATGRLADVLGNLTETLKWQDELVSQTKKLVLYPAFVGTVVLGVIFFLMVYLVPKLVGFIKSMNQTLPWNTKLLIAVSNFFVHYWWLILASPFLLMAGVAFWKASDGEFQYKVDKLKLRIPLLGGILKKIVLARFANYFALMYDSGITILDCLVTLEGVIGNVMLARGVAEARVQIAEGQTVSSSFERSGMFPSLVIRMLRVGENTGALDKSLQNVGYFYNRDVKESIERAQALVEPIMTVVLGLLLGSVMLSVLGPIYNLISKLKT